MSCFGAGDTGHFLRRGLLRWTGDASFATAALFAEFADVLALVDQAFTGRGGHGLETLPAIIAIRDDALEALGEVSVTSAALALGTRA